MEILSSAPHTLHLFAEYACAAIEFISIIIILCGVAAAIARGLRLNEDLVEAIALGKTNGCTCASRSKRRSCSASNSSWPPT